MESMKTRSWIVYASPAGTTRHVAQVVEEQLKKLGCEPEMFDLGKKDDVLKLHSKLKDGINDCCLWIGSPVYAGHALPSIMQFISELPLGKENSAVPFATWGAVTSGVALSEMGTMLSEKGYTVLGAAKIGAVHSMMWESKDPLGGGHPDTEDDQMMDKLVQDVCTKLTTDPVRSLPLAALNYQPEQVQGMMQKVNMEVAKKMLPPLQLNEAACTKCAVCEKECPAFAITLDPYPRFGEECFLCYNCIQLCEEDAITSDLSQVEGMLKGKAAQNPERPLSQVFF
jgi:ferredoxin/flavodoxin